MTYVSITCPLRTLSYLHINQNINRFENGASSLAGSYKSPERKKAWLGLAWAEALLHEGKVDSLPTHLAYFLTTNPAQWAPLLISSQPGPSSFLLKTASITRRGKCDPCPLNECRIPRPESRRIEYVLLDPNIQPLYCCDLILVPPQGHSPHQATDDRPCKTYSVAKSFSRLMVL